MCRDKTIRFVLLVNRIRTRNVKIKPVLWVRNILVKKGVLGKEVTVRAAAQVGILVPVLRLLLRPVPTR